MGGLLSSCMRDTRPPEQQFTSERQVRAISEADLNLAKLRNLRNDIYEKEKALDLNINESDNQIRKLMSEGKREQAKIILQRKKLFEGYQEELMKKSAIVENTIIEYQKTKLDKGMTEALIGAQKVIQDINKDIDLEKLVSAIDDANRLSQKHEEMNRLLDEYHIQNVGDLDAELNKIQAENLQKDFNKVGHVNAPEIKYSQQNLHQSTHHKQEKKELDKQMEELLN